MGKISTMDYTPDIKIYAPDKYVQDVRARIKDIQTARSPSVVRVENGTVWPVGKPREHGVYDACGQFVAASNIVIRATAHQHAIHHAAERYIDDDVLFLGNLHHHFGHVLLERLTRAWALLSDKYKNMKCVIVYSSAADNIPEYYLEFLAALGVARENIMVIKQPTRFRNVYVPELSKGPNFTTDAFAKTFDAIANSVPDNDAKYDCVYVSRDALRLRRTFGERAVQSVFQKNGFHVIYPETMLIQQQIAIVKNCRVLAGCAGTALHLALFMRPGGTVIQIKRNSKNSDNADQQFLVNKTKGLNSVFVWASAESRPTEHFTPVPQIIGVGKYMQKFMDDFGLQYTHADTVISASEWAAYENAWREYRRANSLGHRVKHALVKILACAVPGRDNRAAFRNYMKRVMGV